MLRRVSDGENRAVDPESLVNLVVLVIIHASVVNSSEESQQYVPDAEFGGYYTYGSSWNRRRERGWWKCEQLESLNG